MPTEKKYKNQSNRAGKRYEKRPYKRNEQEPTNPNLSPSERREQGQQSDPSHEQGGTGSADPKFDQTKPLTDDWGKSDKH